MVNNLIALGYVYAAFALVYMLNIILGIAQNCFVKCEPFDMELLLKSLLKIVINAVGVCVIAATFYVLERGVKATGMELDDTVTQTLSVLTFVLLYIKDFFVYAKDVYDKMSVTFLKTSEDMGTQGVDDEEMQDVYNDTSSTVSTSATAKSSLIDSTALQEDSTDENGGV